MTQMSDKSLLSKTEKTQKSGQTQIIRVGWGLCYQGGLEMLNSCCFTKVYLSILYSDQLKYLHCLGFRRAAMLGGKGGIREIWRINWPGIAQVDKSRAGTLLDIIWQITLAATAALLSGLCVFNSWTTVWEDVAQLSGTRNSYLTPEQAIWHQKQLSGTRNSYLAPETAIWHQKQLSGTRNSYLTPETAIWYQKQLSGTRNS